MALLRSFAFAIAGLRYLLRTQRNFRIETAAALLVIGLALAAGLDRTEWLAVTLTIALVLILEAVNTAIEDAVTLARPGFDAKARAAKDVSAAAVLVAALASLVVGAIVFVPRLTRVLIER